MESERSSETLKCKCIECQTACAPYKVEYQYSNHLKMDAICPACGVHFWLRFDLTQLQLKRNEEAEIAFTFSQLSWANKEQEVDQLTHTIYELTRDEKVEE